MMTATTEIERRSRSVRLLTPLLLTLLLTTLGCQTVYYKAMEQFGVHKRDLLVSEVNGARDAQVEAKEQFQSALERFSALVDFDGGELEARYRELKAELDRSESRARAVSKSIKDVEQVASALFKEWAEELDNYSSTELRKRSEAQLKETEKRYSTLIAAMQRAEQRIEPVLATFRDQVLFLKHNLNAQAIASLQGEVVRIETDVNKLVEDLERAIAEAERFMAQTRQSS